MANVEGWHRVCLNTIVRKDVQLDSERLRILPMGSRVHVVERIDRRVRIDQPISGWCSLKSSNGDTILTPLDSDETITTPNADNFKNEANRYRGEAQQKAVDADTLEKNLKKKIEDNPEIEEMANELMQLKQSLRTHTQVKAERDKFSTELETSKKRLDELQDANQQRAESAESYKARIAKLEEELKGQSEGQQILELQKLFESKRTEIADAEYRAHQAETLQKAAEIEIEKMREEMAEMFVSGSSSTQTKAAKYRKGDVVLLTQSRGIVVVRYCGRVDGLGEEELVGVELSDPLGDSDGSYNGNRYFECAANFGCFIQLDAIKKRITPEQLLHQLHDAITKLTRMKNAKE